MPKAVTPSIPLKTASPRARRISAPAPRAMTSGTTPRMNASEVIRIGRSRSRDASRVAPQEWQRPGPRSLQGGLPRRPAPRPPLLGEFDDEDGVLAGQADQDHES